MAYTGNIFENTAHLESLGETKVRESLFRGEFGLKGSDLYNLAEDWLASKESERKAALDTRSEVREEESLSISRKALRNSRWATTIAIIATIIAMSDKVIVFLRWLGALKP
jgi:hypothetical protein